MMTDIIDNIDTMFKLLNNTIVISLFFGLVFGFLTSK